jgi:ferredoxin
MKIRLDETRCVAAGQCVQAAPTVFGQDEDGIVQLLDEQSADVESGAVKQAVRLCPTRVISLSS